MTILFGYEFNPRNYLHARFTAVLQVAIFSLGDNLTHVRIMKNNNMDCPMATKLLSFLVRILILWT